MENDGIFRVLYHGAYLPLHGTEVIAEARAFFERELSMSVVRTQLKEILARMGF